MESSQALVSMKTQSKATDLKENFPKEFLKVLGSKKTSLLNTLGCSKRDIKVVQGC